MQELAARYLPLVYTVVGRAADNDLDVDDIVQETMVRLVTGLPGLREQTRLRSWVVTIALRQLADARGAARQQRLARGGRLTELVEYPDPASDFVGLIVLRQALSHEQREVAEAARWLDPAYRDLLSLWWLEVGGHLTRADVAAAVGQPVPHVGVRVQRMREQLDAARRVVGTLRTRPGCPGLGEVTVAWDGQPDPLWRKRIARHVQACAACTEHTGRLVPPERLLAGLPLPVPPVHLTAIIGSGSDGIAGGTDTAECHRQIGHHVRRQRPVRTLGSHPASGHRRVHRVPRDRGHQHTQRHLIRRCRHRLRHDRKAHQQPAPPVTPPRRSSTNNQLSNMIKLGLVALVIGMPSRDLRVLTVHPVAGSVGLNFPTHCEPDYRRIRTECGQ